LEQLREKLGKRNLVRLRRLTSLVIVFLGVLIVGYGIIYSLNFVFSTFNFAVKVGLIDVPTLVTILVVEAMLGLFHWFFGRKESGPSLSILDEARKVDVGDDVHYTVYVQNLGKLGAESCVAKLTLGYEAENVIGADSVLSNSTFALKRNRIDDESIMWFPFEKEHIDIRPDEKGRNRLDLFKVVKNNEGKPSKFIFPSIKGWNPALVVLKPATYEGVIKISPMNDKPCEKRFVINYDEKTGNVTVTFPLLLV